MFHKIVKVMPLADFKVQVLFADEKQKIYDIKPLFAEWKAFLALKDVDGLFKQVQVDQGGYGISWNDEIDLSCNELYDNGVDI